MEQETLPVKVYYMVNGANKEIRKFTLDQDAAANYAYVIGRIKTFFVTLLRKELNLYWKDDENEYISVSSDNELSEVIKCAGKAENDVLKLYITVKDDEATTVINNPHPGVVCDGYDKSINGIRYKCTVCHDFDLCSNCEGQQAHPPEHHLLCMKVPNPVSSYWCRRFPRKNKGGCRRNFGQRRCPYPKDENTSKGPEKYDSNKQCGNNVKEFISEMASSFGFDPDVAVTQAQSFIDTFQSENLPEGLKDLIKPMFEQWTQSERSNEETSNQGHEEREELSKSSVNEGEPCSSNNTEAMEFSSSSNDNPNLQNLETTTTENEQSDPSQSQPSQGLYAEAISPFLSQMGMTSQFSNDQLENLGKVMEAAMQDIAAASSNGTSSTNVKEGCEPGVNERHSPDGFVLVEESNTPLNEEEMFEKRLEEALEKMKAMGFDNDGDWLKQLLVAKNTDISKVLDAISPR